MANSYGEKGKRTDPISEAATKSARPGDYPIGSVQSRAVARALMQGKNEEEDFIQIVCVSPDGTKTDGPEVEGARLRIA